MLSFSSNGELMEVMEKEEAKKENGAKLEGREYRNYPKIYKKIKDLLES